MAERGSGIAPRISAVIPTFNRRDLVCRAIDSALAQSRPPDEVIVVDDGSTDDTRAAVEAYGHAVRYLHQANAGCSSARNHGVRAASGDWIAFLDADDVWLPAHLERMAAAVDATAGRAVLYFCDARYSESPGGPSLWEMCGLPAAEDHALLEDASPWALMTRQPFLIPGIVVRRDGYLRCGGSSERLPRRGDTHLLFKLALDQPACAVAGCGLEVTSDGGGGGRLTTLHPAGGRVFWECSADLYRDLLRRSASLAPEYRRELRRRVAVSYWRLSRLAWRERKAGESFRWALKSARLDPRLVGERIGRERASRPRS
jgi:glycosyltransferase involved in cell wall biosynthesis